LLNNILLQYVSIIKDLGIYYSSTLSFSHHIDIITGWAIKVLGFIKHNTKFFSSSIYLTSLYFTLVRSILEYGVVVWHQYLSKDQLHLERVQHKFLSSAIFILKLPSPNHNYSDINHFLNIPSLSSRRNRIDAQFIHALLDNSIDSPDVLTYYRKSYLKSPLKMFEITLLFTFQLSPLPSAAITPCTGCLGWPINCVLRSRSYLMYFIKFFFCSFT